MPKVHTITHVYLFGSLLNGLADHCDQSIPLELKTPSPLWEILDLLPIPSTKVKVAMVNHRAVSRDHVVHPGDRVALFPREYAFPPIGRTSGFDATLPRGEHWGLNQGVIVVGIRQ